MKTNEGKQGKKTVLLVDDDVDYLAQQEPRLQSAGFTVLRAESRKEAEEILEKTRPDAVVTEIMLEDPDAGFTLAYHVKKKDATIPVILATAVESEAGISFDTATEEERTWVKADGYLTKPLRFEQLQRELDRVLEA